MSKGWNLRYAPHLGYIPGSGPLFEQSVASIDIADHARFAASEGFAGLLSPWMAHRSALERARFAEALCDHGLACGCIVYAPIEVIMKPLWVSRDGWSQIESYLDHSIDVAVSLGSRIVAVLLKADETLGEDVQRDMAIAHLRRAADSAAAAGLIIGIEPMMALPGMLLQSTDAAVKFIDEADHPAVRMIFDTGHSADMDGDVLAAYRRARHRIGLLQLADSPGRIEPGAGNIDFTTLLGEARADGLADGLIELEHGWSGSGASGEAQGLDTLRRLDARLGG